MSAGLVDLSTRRLEGRVVTHGHREYDAYACLGPESRAGDATAFRAMVRSARPG